MRRCSWMTAAVLLFAAARAGAGVVTQCSSDTQGGPGAANLASALQAGGVITFQCPAGAVIVFNSGYTIARETTIDGGGRVTLDGGDHVMFDLKNGATLRFVDIAIQNANESRDHTGASIPEVRGGVAGGDGHVELVRTAVTRSLGAFWLRTGSITVRASRLEGNRGVTVHAPAIAITDSSRLLSNSGRPVVASAGTVTIADAEFVGNGTSEFSNCTLSVRRSRFNANAGPGNGGALRINCDATIEKSEFHNNQAVHGGAIYIGPLPAEVSLRRVRFVGNVAQQTGGAIAVETSARPLALSIRMSTFESNRAWQGGAINLERFRGNTRLLRGAAVTFKGNAASERGGAIYALNAGVRMVRGAFVGNEATEGGGAVYAQQHGRQTSEFANSLFTANRSTRGGSAFHGAGATFISTTLDANEGVTIVAEAPMALWMAPNAPATFPIRFGNSILSGAAPPCGPGVAKAPYADLGHTIQHPGVSCGPMPSANPGLGPFFTPMPWSPALNAGNNAACQAQPVNGRDLYGVKRPLITNCAIGAVEGDLPRVLGRWLRGNREAAEVFRDLLGIGEHQHRTRR